MGTQELINLTGVQGYGYSGPTTINAGTLRINFARGNEGCKILGGTNTVAFVSNLTLDGGKIELTGGATTGGFNTNLTFVGTAES